MSHRFMHPRIVVVTLLTVSASLMIGGCGLTSRNKLADSSDVESTLEALANEVSGDGADVPAPLEVSEETEVVDVAPAPPEQLVSATDSETQFRAAPVRLASGSNWLQGGLLGRLRGEDQSRPGTSSADDAPTTSQPVSNSSALRTGEFNSAQSTPRRVTRVTSQTFSQQVLESEVPVMVDFYADWCGPCKLVAPELERFALQQSGVRVVKVNIDHDKKLAKTYRIRSYPTVLLFEAGEPVAQYVGIEDIRAAIGR